MTVLGLRPEGDWAMSAPHCGLDRDAEGKASDTSPSAIEGRVAPSNLQGICALRRFRRGSRYRLRFLRS